MGLFLGSDLVSPAELVNSGDNVTGTFLTANGDRTVVITNGVVTSITYNNQSSGGEPESGGGDPL